MIREGHDYFLPRIESEVVMELNYRHKNLSLQLGKKFMRSIKYEAMHLIRFKKKSVSVL